MSMVCICALSAQHVEKRALFTDDTVTDDTAPFDTATLAQDYLREAIRLVPVDFESPDINLLRSPGLLALLGAQEGNSGMVHKYLGLYHGLEVRRRLWWAMYRLEVHTACVLGSLVRCPEAHSDVGYPRGLHHPAFVPGRDGQLENWFEEWNLTTDLYRVLEHAIADFRASNRGRGSILKVDDDAVAADGSSMSKAISDTLTRIQADPRPHFGAASTRSSDNGRNRCGFQASNILCTIHLARMISSVSGRADLDSACRTARDMMESMESIPLEYIRAVGSPLIQQLAGVGHMLVSVAV
ncbi:C6 transcription factor [Colletotrichum sojae]|uniref:C6 transcription factor n=1 Tax=Colletotrichum sojae TaxID=2175907 RepID=A0A8H6IXN0_9PEZI|nr:C6 transcription factor [Colletotrichum sojae]